MPSKWVLTNIQDKQNTNTQVPIRTHTYLHISPAYLHAHKQKHAHIHIHIHPTPKPSIAIAYLRTTPLSLQPNRHEERKITPAKQHHHSIPSHHISHTKTPHLSPAAHSLAHFPSPASATRGKEGMHCVCVCVVRFSPGLIWTDIMRPLFLRQLMGFLFVPGVCFG